MKLTTATPAHEVLEWIRQQQRELFPQYTLDVINFHWKVFDLTSQKGWAGLYGSSVIMLNPEYFKGPTDNHTAIADILLHELCHHIQAIAHDPHDPPHGRGFRELAYYVNGKLGREAVTIYHSLARTPEGQEAERAQRKALALLARTTSSNEHEAALAAAKYAAFTAANNITLDEHAATLAAGLPQIVKEHFWTAKKKTAALMSILGAVAETHACVMTYIRPYGSYTKFHLYGRPSKISQAYDLADYLIEAVGRVTKQAQKETKETMGHAYWNAFREGVAYRIAKSLKQDHQRRLQEGIIASNGISHIPGLVLQSSFQKEQRAAEEYLRQLHPRLARGESCRGSSSVEGRKAGYAAGSKVSVAKQTTGRGTLALTGG